GVPTGYFDLDELLSGLQPSTLVVVGARPSLGKCVAWDTPIVDAATGAVRTAAGVHAAGLAGADVPVPALGREGDRVERRPSTFVDDGFKPVYRVRTRSGRVVRTTASHPFLTPVGWRPLADLAVGQHVGVPGVLPVFGTDDLPTAEVDLLAHLVAAPDGDAEGTRPSTDRAAVADDLARCSAAAGVAVGSEPRTAGQRPAGRLGDDPVLAGIAQRHHLVRPPQERRVPPAVFRLRRPLVARFLHRVLGVAGSVWRPSGDRPGSVRVVL